MSRWWIVVLALAGVGCYDLRGGAPTADGASLGGDATSDLEDAGLRDLSAEDPLDVVRFDSGTDSPMELATDIGPEIVIDVTGEIYEDLGIDAVAAADAADGAPDVAPLVDAADVPPDTGPPPCPSGQTRCDGLCVETANSIAHCGACGSACPARANAAQTCTAGACGFRCNAGYADCDGDAVNGCETDLRTNSSHCGRCGRRCGDGAYCSTSLCRPTVSWNRVFGGVSTGTGRPDNGYPAGPAGYSIASDDQGNLYVTGYFGGVINLGSGSLTSAGGSDAFVASFARDGTLRWAHRFGSSGSDRGYGVAVDGAGNVFVVGGFSGSVTLGSTTLASASGAVMDILVASFTSDGSPRWAARYGSGAEDFGLGVTTDPAGNIYVTGVVGAQVDFGSTSVGAGGAEIFVASFSGSGAVRWARGAESSNTSMSVRVASDGRDAVAIVGYTEGTVDFGAGPLTSPDRDAFVAVYGDAGALRWVRRFSSVGTDAFHGVAFDATGNVFVTGTITGDVDLGGGVLLQRGSTDIVVASFNPAGSHRWSRRYGGPGEERGYGLAADTAGNIYISGSISGAVDLGAGVLSNDGGLDGVAFSLNPSGAHRWSRRFGGIGNDELVAGAVDRSGRVSVTGLISDAVDLDGPTPVLADGVDAFMMQLDLGPI